jgi:hypothetical protein
VTEQIEALRRQRRNVPTFPALTLFEATTLLRPGFESEVEGFAISIERASDLEICRQVSFSHGKVRRIGNGTIVETTRRIGAAPSN